MNLAGHHTKPVARGGAESLNQRAGRNVTRRQKSKVENYESVPQIKVRISKIDPYKCCQKNVLIITSVVDNLLSSTEEEAKYRRISKN